MLSRVAPLAALLVTSAVALEKPGTAGPDSAPNTNPSLIDICLITKYVPRLVDFYGRILRIQPKLIGNDYAELPTAVGKLTIFSAAAQESYIPHSAEPASNRTAILEFEVRNVDEEYARLQSIVTNWVKPPTTQPWGTRSIYFRDPDGNLVNFFAPVKSK